MAGEEARANEARKQEAVTSRGREGKGRSKRGREGRSKRAKKPRSKKVGLRERRSQEASDLQGGSHKSGSFLFFVIGELLAVLHVDV